MKSDRKRRDVKGIRRNPRDETKTIILNQSYETVHDFRYREHASHHHKRLREEERQKERVKERKTAAIYTERRAIVALIYKSDRDRGDKAARARVLTVGI